MDLDVSRFICSSTIIVGKVWTLLYDLSFGDDPSIFQFIRQMESLGLSLCLSRQCGDKPVVVSRPGLWFESAWGQN